MWWQFGEISALTAREEATAVALTHKPGERRGGHNLNRTHQRRIAAEKRIACGNAVASVAAMVGGFKGCLHAETMVGLPCGERRPYTNEACAQGTGKNKRRGDREGNTAALRPPQAYRRREGAVGRKLQ